MLIFSETLNCENDAMPIDGFIEAFRVNYADKKTRGFSIYIKDNVEIPVFKYINDFDNTWHLDLVLFKINNCHIICGYKSPGTKMNKIKSCLKFTLEEINVSQNIILMGDFNLILT